MSIEALSVLVVEDHDGQRELLVSMLEALGVRKISQAASGQQSIALLRSGDLQPDVVISDLSMPDGDGFDVMRATSALRNPPMLIVISAAEQDVLDAVGSLHGHVDSETIVTLAKPVAFGRLRELLESVTIKRRRAAISIYSLPEIERGIAAGEFVPFLEPKVDLRTGAVVGFEALARWRHPTAGLIGPAAFIPPIESTPLMLRFTLSLFDNLLKTRRALRDAGFEGTVSINFGAECLSDESFPALMLECLQRAGLADGSGITLELTESSGIGSQIAAVSGLTRLRLLGFELALDDFGMGHSSLANLQNGPFSEIKIDRQFAARVLTDRISRAAIESVLSISHSLGWKCVAEGIETEAVRAALYAIGCRIGQGYLYSKPIESRDIVHWWQTWRCPASAYGAIASLSAAETSGTHINTLDAAQLSRLDQRLVPMWLFDLEAVCMRWANPAALRFWQARSLAELIERDFKNDLTAATRERLLSYRDILADGLISTEQWTLYPMGVPTPMDCILTGVTTSDGQFSMLVEAFRQGTLIESATLESETLRASGVPILALATEGQILWRNPAASRALGSRGRDFGDLFESPGRARMLLADTLSSGELVSDVRLRTPNGPRWHRMQLRTSRDPDSGRRIIVASQTAIDDLIAH